MSIVIDLEADNPPDSGLSQSQSSTPLFPPTTSGMTVGANVDGAAAASVTIDSNNNGNSGNMVTFLLL